MKIGVIADTHGDVLAFEKTMDILKDTVRILHAGDILYHGPFNPILPTYNPLELAKMLNRLKVPIIFAKGNCDSEVDTLALDYPIESPYVYILAGNLRILIQHGHSLSEDKLLDLAKKGKVNLVVSGHTHTYQLEEKEGVIFLNPGSPSLPKGDKAPSVATIDDEIIRIISLDDKKTLAEKRI